MDRAQADIARQCLAGAEENTLNFPQIVGMLIEAGFESYSVDLHRAVTRYYLPDGESVELPATKTDVPVAASFDADAIKAAIKEAQMQVPGYTYKNFCRKIAAAGCAGYMVSFLGKRVVYFGRTGDTHVEHFPSGK